MTAREKQVRERCEKFRDELNRWRMNIQGGYPVEGTMLDKLESFAREIRNEVLEEAMKLALNPYGDEVQCLAGDEPMTVGNKIAECIRALKEST